MNVAHSFFVTRPLTTFRIEESHQGSEFESHQGSEFEFPSSQSHVFECGGTHLSDDRPATCWHAATKHSLLLVIN